MKPFSKDGLGLPMILGACGILAIATGVVGAYAVANLNTLSREQVYDQCHYGSYSGIQWALSQVSSYPATSCANPTDIIQTLGFSSSDDLRCDVYIYSNLPQASTHWTVAPDGTGIPQGVIYVVANSKLLHNTSGPGARSAQLTALCTPSLFYFNNALLADTGATVKAGSLIDAYTGVTYATNTSTPTTANITTNDVGANSIAISDAGTTVHGGALVGAGGTVNPILNLDPLSTLDGPNGVLGAAVPMKLANPPGQPYTSLAAGTLSTIKHLVGGTTYLISGDLNVGSGGGFFVDPNPAPPTPATAQDDDVFVFVQGDITVNSGAVLGDPTQKADALQIYVPKRKGGGPGHNFTMDGAKGSFLLAGPDLTATVKNSSEVQGAIIADKVVVDNSKVHYDSSLYHKARGPMGWSVGGFDSDHNKGSGTGSYGAPPAPYIPPGPVPPGPPGPPAPPAPPPPPSPPSSPPSTTSSTGSSMLP